jgi:hypothetical protein
MPNRTRNDTAAISATKTSGDRRPRRRPRLRTASIEAPLRPAVHACYLTSVSSLNIGMYIEITIVPTIAPTPIIRSGSMIEVSD